MLIEDEFEEIKCFQEYISLTCSRKTKLLKELQYMYNNPKLYGPYYNYYNNTMIYTKNPEDEDIIITKIYSNSMFVLFEWVYFSQYSFIDYI